MICTLDKAMVHPGDTVTCNITHMPQGTAQARLQLIHLQHVVSTTVQPVTGDASLFAFPSPRRDFMGYLLRADALDGQGEVLASAYTAMDCSSTWTRFPRYGYVWDFTTDADVENKLTQLARYHINGLQFYDWQYRHHLPVAPDTANWTDWSGRMIDGSVVRGYLSHAHVLGMACMAYNMVYAANMTYKHDNFGVQAAWRLIKESGENFTCEMDAKLGEVGVLQYFNLLNPDWQRYIFAREREVFETFGFDGWHGDTIGENGRMMTENGEPLGYDAQGNPILTVKDGYTPFLNAAKRAIGSKYLAFNPVGAQGIENVNLSDVDVLYTEFWPWDADNEGNPYDNYYSLHRAILQAMSQSGGKSLVVAAYVNYRNPALTFNESAVRLLDSVVFASGGARIELGNGDGMLSDEYFPADRNKRMDEHLQQAMLRLYDFAVAYQNLLRDGQTPIRRTIDIAGVPGSPDGRTNTIWGFAKADATGEVYHLINLIGTDADWRDTAQSKVEPTPLHHLSVKLYTAFPAQFAYMATPDQPDLCAAELPFTRGSDAKGAYIALMMPGLAYWNMIFLR